LAVDCLIQLFRDWIECKELGLLDSSICCKSFRPEFLRCISLSKLVFTGFDHQMKNELIDHQKRYGLTNVGTQIGYFEWLKIRGIKVDRLILINFNLSSALLLDLSHITKLYYHYDLYDEVEVFTTDIDDRFYMLLRKCGASLEELYFWDKYPPTIHQMVLTHCPNIKILSHGHGPTDSHKYSNQCTGAAQKLLLLEEMCFSFHDSIFDTVVQNYTERLKLKLLSIKFMHCKMITNISVQNVVRHCKNLSQLSVEGCHNVNDEVFDCIEGKNLECISLTSTSSFSNFGLDRINVVRFPKLTTVNFEHCYSIDDKGILTLCQRCVMLTAVDVSFMHNLTVASAKHIARYLRDLRSVCFIQNQQYNEISKGMHSVFLTSTDVGQIAWLDEYREIRWRPKATVSLTPGALDHDAVQMSLTEAKPTFRSIEACAKLQKLNYLSACIENTFELGLLTGVLSRCEFLVVFRLFSTETANPKTVVRLDKNFWENVAKHCYSLEVLYLRHFSYISYLGVSTLCASNPRLLMVNMADCQVDDDAVFAISYGCTHLQSLDVSFNVGVGDASMLSVMDCCLNLTSLNVIKTSVTSSMVNELYKECKYMRILQFHDLSDIKDDTDDDSDENIV
jgi:hypothetical protein